MLNVTEDVTMGKFASPVKAGGDTVSEIILVDFPLSSARDGKENGDILQIIHYLKQVFWGQLLELDECYARCLLTTVSRGLHQDK